MTGPMCRAIGGRGDVIGMAFGAVGEASSSVLVSREGLRGGDKQGSYVGGRCRRSDEGYGIWSRLGRDHQGLGRRVLKAEGEPGRGSLPEPR